MLHLRPYQTAAVENVINNLDSRPLLVAPTGSGKTVMATAIVKELNRKTLWLAHRKELIDQAYISLLSCNTPGRSELTVGIIMVDRPENRNAQVQVASIQTLTRRNKPDVELIIFDEAHHSVSQGNKKLLENYPNVPVIGLTATPFRLDGKGLGEIYNNIIVAAYTQELVSDGYLHAPRVFAGKSPDLRGVKIHMGDYDLSALSKKVNNKTLIGDIVKTWKEKSLDKRTVCFAVDVEHSQSICQEFINAGVKAEHIDANTPKQLRSDIQARLKRGETKIVCNCMILTEGVDIPELETAILARPTASLNLHLQMIGRIMRICTDKDGAIVLDHAGNHHVHGLVTRKIEYTLHGKTGEKEPLGLRRCKMCQFLFDPHLNECPECGWIVERSPYNKNIQIENVCLYEFNEDFEYQAEMYRLFVAQADAAGYKPGWVSYQFKERFGSFPVVHDGELVDINKPTMDAKKSHYQRLLLIAKNKGFKDRKSVV